MKKLFLVLLALSVWSTLSAQEEFTDGAMEVWSHTDSLTNWTEATGGTSVIRKDSTQKRSGSYSLEMQIDGSQSTVDVSQTVSLTASTECTLSYYHKETGAAVQGVIVMCQACDPDSYLADDESSWGGWNRIDDGHSGSWVEQNIVFTSTSGGNYIIWFQRASGASETLFVDDAHLGEVTAASVIPQVIQILE